MLDMPCRVYMGQRRGTPITKRLPYAFDGRRSDSCTKGSCSLKDACCEAMRDWSANYENTHYLLGTAAGPHPFPNHCT